MSALPHFADSSRTSHEVREVPIVLQKSPSGLYEVEICNYRIGALVLLNRCCAFQPDLESIFLAEMLKILLQHNLPEPDLMQCSKQHRYSITSSAVASSVGGLSSPSVLIFAIGSRRMIVAAAGLCMTAFFHRSGGDLRRSCRIRSNHSNARRHGRRAMRNVILVT